MILIPLPETKKIVESYMRTKIYTNIAQKVNQLSQDSTSTDKYQKLIEKLINLKANKWLTFQENLKRMHSTKTKQIKPCMKTEVNTNTNTEENLKTTEQTKEKWQRLLVRPLDINKDIKKIKRKILPLKNKTQLKELLNWSKLDYSCFIYWVARKTYLKELNTIHHQGLRLALGAYSTSPVKSLYTEADEPPLTLRHKKLALQYSTKPKSCPSNPAIWLCLQYKQHFERKEKSIKPLGLWMKSTLQESIIPLNTIHVSTLLQMPPWIIKKPKVILKLNKLSKTKTHPSTYQEKYHNILQLHPDHQYLYRWLQRQQLF